MRPLPPELLSAILTHAATQDQHALPSYTYGLSRVPPSPSPSASPSPSPSPSLSQPAAAHVQRVLSGRSDPTTRRWKATEGIRGVSREWHDWACWYALGEVRVRRWRGGERWLESDQLIDLETIPSDTAVYRDPYRSLKKTIGLFGAGAPALGSYVRRVWIDGHHHSAETNALIFDLLDRLPSLQHVTVPWTALRFGTGKQWARLLGARDDRAGNQISSLELLAVHLKASEIAAALRAGGGNGVSDQAPLDAPDVDFGCLARVKMIGSTNHMALVDDDLRKMARTATKLREIHITGTASVSIHGVMALAAASRETLHTLEYTPLVPALGSESDPTGFFAHSAARSCAAPDDDDDHHHHLCTEILRCRRLRTLSVSLPSLCADLFDDDAVAWAGELQIRAAALCGESGTLRGSNSSSGSVSTQARFWHMLERARAVMRARAQQGVDLNIEIFIENTIFEPRLQLVHANIALGESLSAGSWPAPGERLGVSGKGADAVGKGGEAWGDHGGYSVVGEGTWREGVERGWIGF